MRGKTHFKDHPKEKVGTILDKEVVQLLREKAAQEGRAISEIIQDAVLRYEGNDSSSSEMRLAAVGRFCSKPFNLTAKDIDEILKEDYYDQ